MYRCPGSKSCFANSSVHNCHRESRQNQNVAYSIPQIVLNMIVAIALEVSKTDIHVGQRSERVGRRIEIDYNLLKKHIYY